LSFKSILIITSKFNTPGQNTQVKQIAKINTEITVAAVVTMKGNINYLVSTYLRPCCAVRPI